MRKLQGLIVMLLIFISTVHAQTTVVTDELRKQQRMQQSIYIVLGVVITIMIGLFIYLFTIDRKISKLEKGE
ncbi:MAG: hypothetical protein AMXMBFR79_05560 [Chitinophagaceae bacterium]|nr:CcmD family protein [Chitinophagaceae bacterium]MCZ2298669.1 hypothetical protein [Chitinophagales bacterium]